MKIRLLRSNSLGFAGTIRNAQHHAQNLLPYIFKVAADVQSWDYSEWLQAHNTHVFVTKDNRKVVLRPLMRNQEYVGISIELSTNIRCAAGKGLLVANILVKESSPDYFSKLMKGLSATPFPEELMEPKTEIGEVEGNLQEEQEEQKEQKEQKEQEDNP